ncbi:hypothetical protein [Pseudoalteromonas sp. S2755]|uniref:hypothetical protein n=1 Tax=Pseudoalteromonas sp. S2755 TaxID=2066523 RepID=UPI00110BD38A|nr:hypothetical protein [Pseudoalteromonas sp. S2755]TMN33664.1 hypothetical protein CWC03_18560 [Pseudoalteromonas sp. S2755]
MLKSDKKQDGAQKILSEPVLVAFPENAKKVRSHLMILCFVSLFLTLGGVGIDPSSTFFGLKFKNLDDELIFYGLVVLLVYQLIQFVWYSYDALQEWELRTTGTKGAFSPVNNRNFEESVHPDFPSDARNSTLYYWWKTQTQYIGNLEPLFNDAKEKMDEFEKRVHEATDRGNLSRDTQNISTHVKPLKKSWAEVSSSLKAIEETLGSDQIPVSLGIFERRFKFFLVSQNLRWILVEYATPIALASVSLYFICERLASNG